LATVTAVQPPGRFGALDFEANLVTGFRREAARGRGWVNGGFFVLSPGVGDYIDGDAPVWEREPMERLARDGQLAAHRHLGFWQPVDTLRDLRALQELWGAGSAPWRS